MLQYPHVSCFRRRLASVLLTLLIVWPNVLLAQSSGANVQNEINKLIHDGITWMQRIAGMLMIGGFVMAGTKFFSDDHADQAWASLKKATIGAIVVGGAVGLAQWVKSAFSMQTF